MDSSDGGSFFEAYLPALAKGTGWVLVVIPVGMALMLPSFDLPNLLGHLLAMAPLVAVLLYGGYWLERSNLPPSRWPRIGKWFLGALVFFLAQNLVMIAFWGTGFLYSARWAMFAAGIGGAAGLAIGLFEARAIENELAAERSRHQKREAEQRSEQFEDFARIVSHDLRNPLNVALGRLQLAREDHDSSHLEAIEDALRRMDEIIQEVLLLTWSGQGIDPEDIRECSLEDVAATCWDYVETPNATLRVEDDLTVRANEKRLQRLLENLFRNSVQHGGEQVTVHIGTRSDGFFVEDDGVGISPENREEVFKAGYSSGEEGTGLGLSIVDTIATTHGWDVSLKEGREGGVRIEFLGVNGERG